MTDQPRSLTSAFLRAGTYVTIIVGAGLLVYLSQKYEQVAEAYGRSVEALQRLTPGSSVPTFAARTVQGETLVVGEDDAGGRQLIFVFTTTCPYCRASLPAIATLHAEVSEPRGGGPPVHLMGLALDEEGPVEEYVLQHDLAFPVTTFPSQKLKRLYRARTVPMLVVLNEEGRVLYSRLGVLESEGAIDSVLTAARGPDPFEPAQ